MSTLSYWEGFYNNSYMNNLAPMRGGLVRMALQFKKPKQYMIYLARNTRTATVKSDLVVDEDLLHRMQMSGEWRLIGVKEFDGFIQDTLESGAKE